MWKLAGSLRPAQLSSPIDAGTARIGASDQLRSSAVCTRRIRLSHAVEVDLFVEVEDFLSCLDDLEAGLVANHNLHSVYVALADCEFRAALRDAAVIHADGWPLVKWMAHGCGLRGVRLGYRDWTDSFFRRLPIGSRVALIGGTAEENRRAVSNLGQRFEPVVFMGIDGYRDEIIYPAWVVANKPDHVFVGLGMGKQERVALVCLAVLPAVYFCAGGWIRQTARLEKLAPDWVVASNMEWLWRLVQNPREKWRRYLVEPWTVLLHIVSNSGRAQHDRQWGG